MTDLRARMQADLRARGVLATAPEDRDRAIDAMIAGGELLDGTEVCVTSGDWREVIAHVDAIHGEQPGRRAAVLAGAITDPERWLDLARSAQDWQSEALSGPWLSQDPGASDRVLRPPARSCWEHCGGGIEEPIAAGFRRRWVCRRCGLEWQAGVRDGAPVALAVEASPRWLGASPEVLFGERA